MDLKFLLEDLFLDNVKETVMNYKQRNMEKVEKFAKNDNFMIVSGQGLGKKYKKMMIINDIIHIPFVYRHRCQSNIKCR